MIKKSLVCGAIIVAGITTGCSTKNVDLPTPPLVEDNTTLKATAVDMAKKAVEEKLHALYFAPNAYLLNADMQKKLEENSKRLEGIKIIRLEGNCDERGSDEYNMALGLKRAEFTKQYLLKKGVKNVEIQTISLGETQQVCTEATEECWAKNRRVDTKLP